jgi:four helix bundle protein
VADVFGDADARCSVVATRVYADAVWMREGARAAAGTAGPGVAWALLRHGGVMTVPARDLAERSRRFAIALSAFVEREQRRRVVSARMLDQLLRAGTAIGAHNAEADAAITRRHLLALRAGALKEALEAEYWLDVIAAGGRCHSEHVVADLRSQLSQLTAILTSCVKRLRGQ